VQTNCGRVSPSAAAAPAAASSYAAAAAAPPASSPTHDKVSVVGLAIAAGSEI
jgi:hypothetical protein